MDIVVDAALVRKIAALARLDLPPDEMQALQEHLRRILDYVKQMDSLSLDGVEPSASDADQSNPLRDDTVRPSLPREALIRAAPDAAGGFFKVPKILDADAHEE